MFDIIKPIEKPASAVAVFAMVANERDLLPHFLAHYRQLGIDEFHFLVDKSSDGTQEWLMTQQDCAVMTCRYKFGDDVELEYMGQPHKGRFANMARGAAARTFMMGRWCLILDADEFLVLPEDVPDIPAWTRLLDNMQLDCCRALMVDYFPEQLQDLNHADAAMSPFDIAPFYDSLSWDWASDSNAPNQISYERAVRARIAKRLLELYPDHTEIALGVPKMLFKTPLIKVHPDTHMFNPHQCNHLSSDKIQVALAHFKFLPGWQAKVNEAVDQKQYVNGSIKYVPLKLAANDLTNWPLRGSHSVDSRITPLSQSEMVFNHLPTQPSIKHHRAAKRPVPKPIIWKEPNRKNLSPLHIANRGARNSTVTGVAWIDEYRLVANHRDGMRVALFDVRKGESPLAVADLPNLNDDVAVWSLGDGSWEVVISDCWHGLYTKLRLTLEPEPVFERLTTQWNNRKTFSHGVNYDSQGQLWLALMTGMDPRIEIDGGGGVWRLPRPWGC